jgi:S1-C subfamily serine protease
MKLLIINIFLFLFLSACQTTGVKELSAISSTLEKQTKNLTKSIASLNPLKADYYKLEKLINQKRYSEAKILLDTEREFFIDYFQTNNTDILNDLSNYVWQKNYDNTFNNFIIFINKFKNVKVYENENWFDASDKIKQFNSFNLDFKNEFIFKLKKPNGIKIINFADEAKKIENFYIDKFNELVEFDTINIFENNLNLKQYPWKNAENELSKNNFFQNFIVNKINKMNPLEIVNFSQSNKAEWLKFETKEKIDKIYSIKLREDLLKDGNIELNEILKFSKYSTGIFNTLDKNNSFIKIGFVDTTSPDFKNRNRFDFKVSLKNDLKINFTDMTSKFLSNNIDKDTDFLFMMNLTTANISRKFNDKDSPSSTFIQSYRQEQNPAYVNAYTKYQSALTDLNSTQIRANSSDCSGPSVGLAIACGFAQGMAVNIARDNVKKASNLLGKTPQTVSKPNYQNYQYRLVDINSNKTASFEFLLINLKKKVINKSFVDINDNEVFTVIYDVHPKDPNKGSLISDYSTEKKVAEWEKNDVNFNISKILNPQNLVNTEKEKFTNISELQSTLFVAANETKNNVNNSNTISKSGAIADPRFNSVVIVKAGSGTGTGFYVTPDIILTAYHVVEKSSLVQLEFYNGRQNSGRIIAHDIRLDLALIKADAVGIPLDIFSGNIRLGSTVEAIGHPQGLSFTITRGIVSSLRKQASIYTKGSAKVEFVQSDTPVSPGNSGGPLFLGNKVIGVVDFGNVEKYSQNLNFSVSFNEVRNFLRRNKVQ